MFISRFVCSIYLSFFFIIPCLRSAAAQPQFLYHFCINDRGNYTANSVYKANLDHLLSTLTADHQINYGFYNFSYGQHDKAYAIGLCGGDVSPDACRPCLNNSVSLLRNRCPNQKEAIGWYPKCMLRYSDRSLFGFPEGQPSFYMWSPHNASNKDQYLQAARILLDQLRGKAASGDSRLKFATGNTTASNSQTIHGLVQCTPDLSQPECDNCLYDAVQQIKQCCDGRQGGRVVRPSCNIRYEAYRFFEYPPSTTPIDAGGNESNNSSRIIVIIVVPIVVVVVVVLLIISICTFSRSRKRKIKTAESEINFATVPADDEISEVESLQFDFDSIRIATNDFSDSKKLGEGGFGTVYKGRLPNGRDIAVKRLSRISSQGDIEFKNEVLLVAKLQHRNLVQLLGFCLKQNEKLLIYEFVPNSSLEKFLFDPIKRVILDWESRYKIIGGIARGLVYLHEDSRLRIIHRDLKASNILLDAEMNAKIADFGTAKLFVPDQTQGDTSRIVGTYGYMAPEYILRGHFSVKSDVFSFGVLILEIVSGQKNNHVINGSNIEDLISYAWRNWQEGTTLNIIDSSIESGSRTEMTRCIHIGLLCVQENLGDRPTMATVLLLLNSCSITLPRPSQPAFFMNSRTFSCTSSQQNDDLLLDSDRPKGNSTQKSLNDASITELYPR